MSKLLGQHFLKNDAVIKKIIEAIDPQAGEMIFEIGPGHGELTIPLASTGAKIIAIEKDQAIAPALEAKLRDRKITNVAIVNDDILKFLQEKHFEKFTTGAFKLVGNIPYYLTGKLFRTVSELDTKPSRVIFMIQKEVAERIAAEPPRMNRLAASTQVWAEPKIIAIVPRGDFSPAPEVDSAVIALETRRSQIKNVDNYYTVVRALFAQPRKTLLNNLAGLDKTKKPKRDDLIKILHAINPEIKPESRPQDLTIEHILEIAEKFPT